jgi:hypothetical protein
MKDFVVKFFQKNTPEAALIGALLACATGYFSGTLTPQEAVMAAIGALVAFGFAEAGKDGRENQAVTSPADNPQPPSPQ